MAFPSCREERFQPHSSFGLSSRIFPKQISYLVYSLWGSNDLDKLGNWRNQSCWKLPTALPQRVILQGQGDRSTKPICTSGSPRLSLLGGVLRSPPACNTPGLNYGFGVVTSHTFLHDTKPCVLFWGAMLFCKSPDTYTLYICSLTGASRPCGPGEWHGQVWEGFPEHLQPWPVERPRVPWGACPLLAQLGSAQGSPFPGC